MRKLFFKKSDYVSLTLTDDRREELAALIANAKRTTLHDLDETDVADLNELALEQAEIGAASWTIQEAIDYIQFEIVAPETEYYLDDDGNPALDEEGKPRPKATTYPEYKMSYTPKVGGIVDCNGKPIKDKVNHKFTSLTQGQNRPPTESNWKSLAKRMSKWCVNGEVCIRDDSGNSQSEQHRFYAFIYAVLMGYIPADTVFRSFYVHGIPMPLCLSIDTGKSNSGKDIFASDPEIAPDATLQTAESFLGGPEQFVADRTSHRKKICGETESAAKKLLLRGAGKNVNSSIPTIDEPTALAHRFVLHTCPQLDDLVARCIALTSDMGRRRPASASDLACAIALYQWRDEEPLATLPGTKGGVQFDDASLSIDLADAMLLLEEINKATAVATDSPVTTWVNSYLEFKATKQVKFAALCRLVTAFYEGEEITGKLATNVSNYGGSSQSAAKGYYHFGGFDRGPQTKVKKGEESSEE